MASDMQARHQSGAIDQAQCGPMANNSITLSPNDRVAAVITVVSDGNLEVLRRDPFTAKVMTPAAPPVLVQTFPFDPTDSAIVELSVLLALDAGPNPSLDQWIARIPVKLFNVHVAARDTDQGTIVEARSSVVLEGLTVNSFAFSLGLLLMAADDITGELKPLVRRLAAASSVDVASPASPAPATTVPSPVSVPRAAFDGYL